MLWIFWWITNWSWIIKDLRLILEVLISLIYVTFRSLLRSPIPQKRNRPSTRTLIILVGLQQHMPSQVFDNTEKRTETRIYYVFWTSKFFGPSAVPTPYYNSSTFGLATSWKKRFRLTNQRSSYYSQKNTNVCFYRPLFPPTMYHNSAQCQRQPHMYFLVVMKIKRTSFKIDMSGPQFIQNTYLSI